MDMKRLFGLLLFFNFFFCAKGQSPTYMAVEKAELIPWELFTPSGKRFIVAGEAHHVSVIFPFQLSHLRFLVTRGFRHLVWEVPFSYSYIAQQYITTGNDTLLRYLAWSEEDLVYWQGVYQINQTLPKEDKLHLWGIDHELGDDSRGIYKARDFKMALQLMTEGKGTLPYSLQKEYLLLKNDATVKGLTEIKRRLQPLQYLPEVASFFSERLPYFKALVNRLDYYKVGRNDEMLEAFKEICYLFKLDTTSKFLGRFGWGHTDKSYKKSMSAFLEKDPSSPVRGSTFVIGVQYLNCISAIRMGGERIENNGIVSNRLQKKELFDLNQRDPTPIKIITSTLKAKPKGWEKAADVLFVFSGFPGVTLLKR
jgi:hypothetical protein